MKLLPTSRKVMILMTALTSTAIAASAPPVAPVKTVVDEYWGVKVKDPYRYMENFTDSAVQAWVKGEAEYTSEQLAEIPGRDKLRTRIEELNAGSPYRIYSIKRTPSGEYFYFRQAADENLAKLYRRQDLNGKEEMLIDPAQMKAEVGGHFALSFYSPSPDGRYVIFGFAPSGSEETSLQVLDMQSKQVLPDSIGNLEPYYTPPQWLPNSSGFFYCQLRQLPPEAPPTEGYKRSRTFVHRIGDDPSKDAVVFAMDMSPRVGMTDEDFPSIVVPIGSVYMIGKIKHGDANQLTLYSARLSALASDDVPWQMICDVPDSVTDFDVHGDYIYLISSREAPRFKLVRTRLDHPDFGHAEEIIPASATVLSNVNAAKDALYVATKHAGMNRIARVAYETLQPVDLPLPNEAPVGYIEASSANMEGILVQTASWVRRGATYAYDPETGKFTNTGLNPRGKYDDVEGYASEEVMVPSYDGTDVPLSIIYKKGMKRDGSHPTLLTGYGAYGISRNVWFDPRRLAWLERGGIIAVAHVRGGGEFGEEWHLAGQKLTKPNTWKDFIACGEYLVDSNYTAPSKLSGQGGSAGGILIGRAITERPDLFGAALIDVGCLDALRMETTTNGVPNIQEFGTVTKKDEFEGLLAMSSYAHVKDGVRYPAVMLAHGANDPRVEPWMSAKMCARLQAATASDKPILFRVEYHAGHGIGSTKAQYENLLADEWSFLLWQAGDPDFQP